MIKGVPSYASPFEAGLFLAVETERSFAEMMQNIGIKELHSFEENGTAIFEMKHVGADKEKKTNAFIKWLNDRWEDIKKLFEAALKGIKGLIETASKKIHDMLGSKDRKDDLYKRLEALNDKAKDGKEKVFGEDYAWDGYESMHSSDAENPVYKVVNRYSNFLSKAASTENFDYQSEIDDLHNKIKDKLGIESYGAKEVAKAVKDALRGEKVEITKKYLKDHFDDYFRYATSYDETAKKISKTLNGMKRKFDDLKKAVKDASRSNKEDKVLVNTIKIVKDEASAFSVLSGTITSCMRERVSSAIRVIVKLSISAKVKEEKVKQESAIVPSSFQTELASLFNF